MSGDKCLKIQWALNVRATNVWKSKWALNVRRQTSENSHWRQMSLGVKCHMPISRQMSLASIVTNSNRHQRSGLKSLGDKRPRRQTAWIRWVMLSGYSLPERYNVVWSIFDFICHNLDSFKFRPSFRNWLIAGSNRNREPHWRCLKPVSKLYTAPELSR